MFPFKEVSPVLGPMGRCVDDLIAFCEETFEEPQKYDVKAVGIPFNRGIIKHK